MFYSRSKTQKIEPILFPARFLWKKIQMKSGHVDHACLLKYFPKYYKEFSFSRENLTGAIQSKVKRLKIVRHCYFRSDVPDDDEKVLKKLFRTNRKTLKDIPSTGISAGTQDFSLCFHFPRVKTINLQQSRFRYYFCEQSHSDQSTSRKIKKSLGYFWRSCRFVENLKIGFLRGSDLAIIKEIESSKRFLSSVKNVELRIYPARIFQGSRNPLIEMMKNTIFLGCVTHLKIENFVQHLFDWKFAEALINCCHQLNSLSLSTGARDWWSVPNPDYSFLLDLSHLQNLYVLKFQVNHIRTFINEIQFPPYLREMTLRFADHKESDNLKEFFDFQEEKEDDGMIEEKDAKDFESFEKSRMLGQFFEKWKKLESLRTLNLDIFALTDCDTLAKDFVLPLLRAVPMLETFDYQFRWKQYKAHKASFDLEVFLSGIEPLRSLKHLRIKTDLRHDCIFSGFKNPQKKLYCLSNLSSIEIDSKFYSKFHLKQFFNSFIGMDTLVKKKSLKLSNIFLFDVQDFIKLLKLMHSVSSFKNFQAYLQITLVVHSIDEIFSNFKYPIYVACNTLLAVTIFIMDLESGKLTQEQEEYFQTVFGQLQFIVKKPVKNNYKGDFFDLDFCSQIMLMKSKLVYN